MNVTYITQHTRSSDHESRNSLSATRTDLYLAKNGYLGNNNNEIFVEKKYLNFIGIFFFDIFVM